MALAVALFHLALPPVPYRRLPSCLTSCCACAIKYGLIRLSASSSPRMKVQHATRTTTGLPTVS